MQTIAVRRGESEPELIEKPRPEPGPDEALVRILRVGVDGTDHEVLHDGPGEFPEDEDHIVLGHEAVGVVEDANGTAVEEGTVVAPLVRRPADEVSQSGTNDELDMAPPTTVHERGITGAHGYLAEYFVSDPQYLVEVPESRSEY